MYLLYEVKHIILAVCMKFEVVLCPPKKDKLLKQIKALSIGDNEFELNLLAKVEEGKSKPIGESFWLSGMWISRFMCRYNLHFGSTGKTMFSKRELFQQLVPSLEFVYALRKAFGVPVGVGRILNADESMSFRYDSKTKSWIIG